MRTKRARKFQSIRQTIELTYNELDGVMLNVVWAKDVPAEGVPEITPVELSNTKPDGRAADKEYDEGEPWQSVIKRSNIGIVLKNT